MKLKPHNCPRYPKCSAAICPLDLRWSQRVHKDDEMVCHLMQIAKTDKADVFFATYFEPGFLDKLHELIPVILRHYPSLAKTIGNSQNRPLSKPHQPKDYHKQKGTKSSPEDMLNQMQEWAIAAPGRATSDLNNGAGRDSLPGERNS